MPLKRVGLIGDVHAHDKRLEAALQFLASAQVERVLCVGDVVDGEGDAERCCQLLRENNVSTVRGNHDRWFLTGQMRDLPHVTPLSDLSAPSLEWLRTLPPTLTLETVGGKLLLGHGLGKYDMAQFTPDDYGYALESNTSLQQLLYREWRFIVGGHTHRRMVRPIGPNLSGETITVINPGALDEKNNPCLAIADFEARCVIFHDFEGAMVQLVGQSVTL